MRECAAPGMAQLRALLLRRKARAAAYIHGREDMLVMRSALRG